jgi:hypothetical protein
MAQSRRFSHPTDDDINLTAAQSHHQNTPDNTPTETSAQVGAKEIKALALEKVDVERSYRDTVDFDGPNDPDDPMNWRFAKKWGMVFLISAITFLTPLASSMFAPSVPEVMQEFESTNNMLKGFMVSVYVLGFAFGPLSTHLLLMTP